MSTLVAVDDLRLMGGQSTFQAVQNECFINSAGELKVHDVAAVPVDDDEEVHESFLHANIGYIHAPDLVWLDDGQVPQQVGTNILSMIAPGEIGLRIYGVDSHIPHNPSYTLPVDCQVISSSEKGRDHPVAPGRFGSVNLINQAHEK